MRIKPSTILWEAFVAERNNIILFIEGRCQMKVFKDTEHDTDSCWDVWEELYKKVYPQFNRWVSIENKEGNELLKTCTGKHHSFENFAFMPITGGMNNLKGRQKLDRPDIHISDLQKYFSNDKENKILSCARNNKEALEWYLSIFNDNIYQYFRRIYLIDDRDFIDKEFLPFSNTKIKNEDSAIQYMKLAIKFWDLRKSNIDKYLKTINLIFISHAYRTK